MCCMLMQQWGNVLHANAAVGCVLHANVAVGLCVAC